MLRRLTIIALSGLICLLGITSALAQTQFSEAPMLKVKVAAGELPAVKERLPEEPFVVTPIEEIGEYGGIATVFTKRPSPTEDGIGFIGHEPILRVDSDDATIIPNIAKGWKFSEDAKELTLYFRKGMKWSDGAPFTADDIMFWYEDMILNDEITPAKPTHWSPGGELMKVEKVDDYTVVLRFAQPYPLALNYLAHYQGADMTYPKRYLKQFHPKYTSTEKLEELMKEFGYEKWFQLFNLKASLHQGSINCKHDPYVPTLKNYVLVEKASDYWIWERNPYYWKVDTAGNQLPYIDGVVLCLVANREMIDAKIVTGEADWGSFSTTLENYPLYTENAEKGNYRVLLWSLTSGSTCYYQVNQTYQEDPVLRDIFRDRSFRIALSLAINREEINEALYFGKAVPRQMTVLPQSKYYEESFARAYAQYDPQEANRVLDEMGLKWDKNREYRLRPDGKKLTLVLEYVALEPDLTSISEMVQRYWKDIGVQLILKEESGELINERAPGNLIQVGLWKASGCTDIMFLLWPWWYAPINAGWEVTAWPLWARWYETGGKEGEEPPEEIKELQRMYERMRTTTDEEERIALGTEICRRQAENLWSIGTIGLPPHPVIVRNNLRNVPETGLHGWDNFWGVTYYPEQRFFKHPLLPSQK